MNPFPTDTPEWLAHEALAHAGGCTADATARLASAVNVLLLWQRIALFAADPGPEEARRG